MRLKNKLTGDVLEVPPPNEIGESAILLNGAVLERVLFSDEDGGTATLGDGRKFRAGNEFSQYVIGRLAEGRE